MNLAANNLVISFLIASFRSWANLRRRYLTGFASGRTFNACSIFSLGTPGMSEGCHAKMSLFSWRKRVSAYSYLPSRSDPIWVTLEESVGSSWIVLDATSAALSCSLAAFLDRWWSSGGADSVA